MFFISAIALANEPAGRFVPPAGKIILIVGQDVENIKAYLESVKIVPAGFAAYTSAEFAEGLTDETDNGGGPQHAQVLVDRYPNTVLQLALYMVNEAEKVYSGDVDESLDKIADWIKSAQRPVFFRIGYEFDLPENYYEPKSYVQAYRYIVDRFRKRGVTNAAYVWHSYASKVSRPHEDWYPGDDYVDWFAISYFDQPQTQMNAMADLAERHKKPLMIAESAPWHFFTQNDDRAWKEWFVPMFKFAEARNVKAISYINCDWDATPLFVSMGWGDTRIQSNWALMKEWIAEISKEKYLKSSPGLFSTLGYRASD